MTARDFEGGGIPSSGTGYERARFQMGGHRGQYVAPAQRLVGIHSKRAVKSIKGEKRIIIKTLLRTLFGGISPPTLPGLPIEIEKFQPQLIQHTESSLRILV